MISNLIRNLLTKQSAFMITPRWNPCFSTKKSQQQQHYFTNRLQGLLKNKPTQQISYPQFKPSISLSNYIQKYADLKTAHTNQHTQKPSQQILAGRISSIRKHGKTIFIDIREQHKKVQIAMKNTKSQQQLQFRRGDIIGVKGIPFITKKGQLSLEVQKEQDIQVLSPCLWMLPEYNSLKDNQLRYRKKHLDLITNQESLEVLKIRSRIFSELRKELQSQGYVQVETPVLSASCGGAIAKPFETFHNDHKMDLFMRIAPELYLKKLIIGGFSKVFQIGKNFRNQSIDQTHNPEFSTCQLYCAYSNYKQMMAFTQNLIKKIVFNVTGSYKLKVRHVEHGETKVHEIDLEQAWKVFDFIPDLEKQAGVKLPSQFQSEESRKILDKLCTQHHVSCDQPRTAGRLLDKLCGKYLQQKTRQPFFIINQPRILSPLAKPHEHNDKIVQRFELFINGWQVVNSYTQLSSPFIQKENTPIETEFIEALEYGLPPTAGWGIGLDRLVMLVAGKERIQEVIAFPLLKDQGKDANSKSEQLQRDQLISSS